MKVYLLIASPEPDLGKVVGAYMFLSEAKEAAQELKHDKSFTHYPFVPVIKEMEIVEKC